MYLTHNEPESVGIVVIVLTMCVSLLCTAQETSTRGHEPESVDTFH